MSMPILARRIRIEVALMLLLILSMLLAAVEPASAQVGGIGTAPADLAGTLSLAAPCILLTMGIIRAWRRRQEVD
jgi:Zn-dependent protease with chaperone function